MADNMRTLPLSYLYYVFPSKGGNPSIYTTYFPLLSQCICLDI